MPGTHVHTTVAKIYHRRRLAGYAVVTTTLQKFIVVVMPGTHVHTTLQKFMMMMTRMMRMMMRAQKAALKSLKIKYIIV